MQKLRIDLADDLRLTTTGADAKGNRKIVIAALSIVRSNDTLMRRMVRCGSRNEYNDTRFFCGHPACGVCMQRRGNRLFRQHLWPALEAVPSSQLRWITVLMVRDASLDDGAVEMDRQHRRLQHVLQKYTGGRHRSLKVRVWGAREVERDGLEWQFHIHMLIDFAGADADRLADLLRDVWGRGRRQVQVKVMQHRSHQANVLRFAQYMCKARYTQSVGTGIERAWMSNEDIAALVRWRDRQSAQWHRFTWGVRGA